MLRGQFEVSVDADLCSGCGRCTQHAPEVFTHVDGVSHVKEAGRILASGEVAVVPLGLVNKAIDAAEDCPGEIIDVRSVEF